MLEWFGRHFGLVSDLCCGGFGLKSFWSHVGRLSDLLWTFFEVIVDWFSTTFGLVSDWTRGATQVVGVPHRALGVPQRVLGVPHRVLGVPHRVLGHQTGY